MKHDQEADIDTSTADDSAELAVLVPRLAENLDLATPF